MMCFEALKKSFGMTYVTSRIPNIHQTLDIIIPDTYPDTYYVCVLCIPLRIQTVPISDHK